MIAKSLITYFNEQTCKVYNPIRITMGGKRKSPYFNNNEIALNNG